MFLGYTNEELIGEGGLGRVFRAVRQTTGGVVAIKELREVPSASPAWHRAKRELDAMLRLKGHPYVVAVEEIIDGPNGPCLVMEYLDGGSLNDRIAGGPLSVPDWVLVGNQVTQALAAAHEAGIVHRDVKPHNLLVGSFGQVKVADFGIAALNHDAGMRTQTHAFTLAYASPEELDGDTDVGPPADVYSFAATMSHLGTGRKPSFRDRSVNRDLDGLAAGLADVAAVIPMLQRCLEHDPANRPTMNDLQRAFAVATSTLGSGAATRLAPWRPPSRPVDSTDLHDGATVSRPTNRLLDEITGPRRGVTAPPPPPPPPPPLAVDATVVRPVAAAYVEPIAPQQPIAVPAEPGAPRNRLIAIGAGVAAAAILVGVLVSTSGGDDKSSATTSAARPTAESEASTSPQQTSGQSSGNQSGGSTATTAAEVQVETSGEVLPFPTTYSGNCSVHAIGATTPGDLVVQCEGSWALAYVLNCSDGCDPTVHRWTGTQWQFRGNENAGCMATLANTGMPSTIAMRFTGETTSVTFCPPYYQAYNPVQPVGAIQPWDTGDRVVALQRRLIELDLLTDSGSSADGQYGPNTRTAVIDLQYLLEMRPDGVASSELLQLLGLPS